MVVVVLSHNLKKVKVVVLWLCTYVDTFVLGLLLTMFCSFILLSITLEVLFRKMTINQ